MIKAFVGFFSNEIQPSELVAGDHIYSYRKTWGYVFAHHGIYVGDDRVIHFMGDPGLMVAVSGGEAALSPFCAHCGFHGKLVGVVDSCVSCFLKGGILRRFRYGASVAQRIAALRSGCCSITPSDPTPFVLARAHLFLLRRSFLRPYHLFHNNCLHFALFCKIGAACPPSLPFQRLLLLLATSCSCFLLFDYHDDYCDGDFSVPDLLLYPTPPHSDVDYSLPDLALYLPYLLRHGAAKQQRLSLVPHLRMLSDHHKRRDLVAETPLPPDDDDDTFSALISKLLLFHSTHLHHS